MKIKDLILVLIVSFICVHTTNSQIERVGVKTFLAKTISKKQYSINLFEKVISKDSYNHNLLLNKAVRFKTFFDGQESTINRLVKNCKINSSKIGITNILIKNTFKQGLKNANYLFKVAKQKEPTFSNEYEKIKEQFEIIDASLKFTDSDCISALADLQMRKQGIFTDDKVANNLLSFNYILNPVQEILDNHTQEFSSLNNASDEDFFFTIDLPKSWTSKRKKDFSKNTTVGFYQPYEKFLFGGITASLVSKPLMTKEQMKSQSISDNDIVNLIYEDDEVLVNLLKIFDSKISTNHIFCTLYNNGNNKLILFKSNYDMGEVSNNDLMDGQVLETFGSILVKNGKVINISGAGLRKNAFNSYDYYSKLFFKTITSIKFKDIKKNTIYLTEEQNMKFIELSFGGLNYKFMLDTGASRVVINKKVLSDLLSSGIITKENYIGDSYAEVADGSIIPCQNWLVPELKIGNHTIKNNTLSVIDSENSMLLFGMDGLNKLKVVKLNLKDNEIILNRE